MSLGRELSHNIVMYNVYTLTRILFLVQFKEFHFNTVGVTLCIIILHKNHIMVYFYKLESTFT